MGNRKLRAEAATALKAAGIPGKLYRGKKLKMFRYIRANDLRHLIFLAKLLKILRSSKARIQKGHNMRLDRNGWHLKLNKFVY